MSTIKTTINQTFKEQLESLPPEFTIAMEEYREGHFGDIFKLLVHTFKIEDELVKMTNEQQESFIAMCKMMHHFGFYGGVSFTLDPDKKFESHITYQPE